VPHTLDYDGTLEPIKKHPEDAKPSRATLAALKRLAKDPHNHVAVISGRDRTNLMEWLGSLPVTLVAEHGGFIRLHDQKSWRKTNQHSLSWEKKVTKLFEYYTAQTPGSFVERKEWSIVWHYRGAAPFYAQKNLVILKKLLKPIAEHNTLGVVDGNMALEVRHLDVSKGHITQEWLFHDQDFILAIGDDTTDEDMFAALPPTAYRIKVGRGRTPQYRSQTPHRPPPTPKVVVKQRGQICPAVGDASLIMGYHSGDRALLAAKHLAKLSSCPCLGVHIVFIGATNLSTEIHDRASLKERVSTFDLDVFTSSRGIWAVYSDHRRIYCLHPPEPSGRAAALYSYCAVARRTAPRPERIIRSGPTFCINAMSGTTAVGYSFIQPNLRRSLKYRCVQSVKSMRCRVVLSGSCRTKLSLGCPAPHRAWSEMTII
jgi:trehalose-phosphatase